MNRIGIKLVVCMALLFPALFGARAADYPARQVDVLVGYSPGGGTDILARLVSQYLTDLWGTPVLVVNRPGANGTIANEELSRATPDGYTLAVVPVDFTMSPYFFDVRYDPVTSFTAIAKVGDIPNVFVVRADLPVDTIKEFIEYAKERPGDLNFAANGIGSSTFLKMYELMDRVEIEMEPVNYQSSGLSTVALLGGEVDAAFLNAASVAEHIKQGRLKALGVSTGVASPMLPDVPTIAEAADLPGFDSGVWYGILGPADLPAEVVDKVREGLTQILDIPELQQAFSAQGFSISYPEQTDFSQLIKNDLELWGTLIESNNLN